MALEEEVMKDLLTKRELSREFGLKERTVAVKVNAIEKLVGDRYSPYSVVRNGKVLMCNVVVFGDYLTFESRLQDEKLKRLVPPFKYEEASRYLNFRKGEEWTDKVKFD